MRREAGLVLALLVLRTGKRYWPRSPTPERSLVRPIPPVPRGQGRGWERKGKRTSAKLLLHSSYYSVILRSSSDRSVPGASGRRVRDEVRLTLSASSLSDRRIGLICTPARARAPACFPMALVFRTRLRLHSIFSPLPLRVVEKGTARRRSRPLTNQAMHRAPL
ncbi:hypothetical protein GQ53DRAFT_352537 [Thozetella sp. PMI_491]|nr:hypothetical protein GQ53DRAFT_352537 [Thozetella sp. PMI_491]